MKDIFNKKEFIEELKHTDAKEVRAVVESIESVYGEAGLEGILSKAYEKIAPVRAIVKLVKSGEVESGEPARDFKAGFIRFGLIPEVVQDVPSKGFGDLSTYLTKFGYLAKGDVELYGITLHEYDEDKVMQQDMIKQTKYIHGLSEEVKTKGLVALERLPEEGYAAVDKSNRMYVVSDDGSVRDLKIKFWPYVLKRIKEAK